MQAAALKPESIKKALAYLDDGRLLKIVFYGLLTAVALALFFDYRELRIAAEREPVQPGMEQPILPAYVPEGVPGTGSPAEQPNQRPEVTADPAQLRDRLTIKLAKGGVLLLTGTIDRGSAVRFEQEMADLGEYAERVELNSPGGSVQDALEISKLIRDAGLVTSVKDGALCASSCPLILAGGEERLAGKKAAIGVHQIYTPAGPRLSADQEISGTQATTAAINRHLKTMDVDPALWLHALETPPRQLYYLNNEELEAYRLITSFE